MKYPQIDKYSDLDSPLHDFEPRLKLVSLLALTFSVVLLPDIKLAALGFAVALGLVISSKLPFSFIIYYAKWVALFTLPFLIILPFTVKGEKLWSLGFLVITNEGIEYGTILVLRALSAAMLMLTMVATTGFVGTIKALDKLRIPEELTQLLTLSYRYIFVLISEAKRILRALKARGFKQKADLYTLKTTGKVIGMLFVKSYERAERVHQALKSRGYQGGFRSSSSFNVRNKDVFAAFLLTAIAILLHCLRWVI